MENQNSIGIKKLYFIGIAIAGILAVFAYAGFLSDNEDNGLPKNDLPLTETSALVPQTNDEGGVIVAVTPLGQSDWSFEVSLTTHSGNLGEDLAEVSVLIDGKGNEYQPIAWEGDPPGGHHRSGILRFSTIAPAPESVTLVIRRIGGVRERKFVWIIPN